MWSIEKRDKGRMNEISDSKHTGSLIIYRAEEVDSEKVSQMTKEMVYFGVVVTTKEKNKFWR